jgi:hypothetical protein
MSVKSKRFTITAILIFVWFLIADAYWTAKEREVGKCSLSNATELVKNGISVGTSDALTDAVALYDTRCSWVIGAGNYWNSPRGMAYWEMLLMGPVIYRFRFDL